MVKVIMRSMRGFVAVLAVIGSLFLAHTLAISAGTTIDLTDQSTTSGTSWTYDASANTYHITGDVTIIGSVVEATATLTLDIAAGARADWAAEYASASTYHDTLLSLPGDGELNILPTSGIRNAGSGVAIRATGEGAKLTVSGTIDSQTGSAIWADGTSAVVVVDGGMVTSVGTSTLQPTIYMRSQDNTITNVTVSGTGYIAANDYGAPAIQTYGSVVVEDSATVYQVGGSGAGRGPAINALGDTSSVVVRGGQVWSDSGVAVHTNGPGASVVVAGGQVFSRSGARAIYSQDPAATVTVEAGFVFANNTSVSGASSAAAAVINSSHLSTDPAGVVVAWDAGAGQTTYTADTASDLAVLPLLATARWQQDAGTSGIAYYGATGQNVGFFDMSAVTVTPVAGTLYFDVASGAFYSDYDLASPYTGQADLWSWDGGTLSLRDFRWTTSAGYALYIMNGDIEIRLDGTSEFRSEAVAGGTTGILSDGDITFAGSGAVFAAGGDTDPGSTSYGISASSVLISGGTVTAQGETMAIFNSPPDTTTVSISGYVYWESPQMSHPGGTGVLYVDGTTDAGLAYTHSLTSKYLKVEPLEELGFTAVQVGGRPDSADSTGIVLTFDEPIEDLAVAPIIVSDGSGRVDTGSVAGAGTTWIIELERVFVQGEVTVHIGHFDTYLMETPAQTLTVYRLLRAETGPVAPRPPNAGAR